MDRGKRQLIYQFTVKGRLRDDWVDWFGGMNISHETDGKSAFVTILSGAVVDQAALHGILARLRDLNLELLSVCRSSGNNPGIQARER